ncbi:peptidylprolyl isomerase [Rubinisphaera sp. JC750]|uniref:peptidylprolyl isomerase n=1 Tax=Rubinisphaera sp. JC750 TaxID=2898658 RepID=UPI001F3752B3|nr:peptidylprolyl isomerase [Rubinisphaera sp. JC750]
MTAKIERQPDGRHPSRHSRGVMSAAALLLIGGTLCVSGCQQIKEHFNRVRPNNPVVGPAPPRLSLEESSADTLGYAGLSQGVPESGEIRTVSQVVTEESPVILDSTVVAVVNGNTVLAGDVFAPYARQMVKMREQLTDEQYLAAQRELLKRDLPGHIERTLLSHALKSTLKQEQIDKLDGVLDQAFAEHVEKLLVKTETSSALELDKKLQSEGTSLADIRQTFGTQQLAMQYLATESQVNVQLGRVDLLNYYRENLDRFSHPTRVKWQEIRVSITPQQDRRAAVMKLNEVVKKLQEGAAFPDVAREYSDGPTASQGGNWDWTKEDSLADVELNKELFSLPTGAISRIIETDKYFRIIRVVEREDAHVTPFEKLQDGLREEIRSKKRHEKTAEVLRKLNETAVIQTIFDDDPALAEEMRKIGEL